MLFAFKIVVRQGAPSVPPRGALRPIRKSYVPPRNISAPISGPPRQHPSTSTLFFGLHGFKINLIPVPSVLVVCKKQNVAYTEHRPTTMLS